MAFTIRSAAFNPGEPIPTRYTCDGENISPPLAWDGQPDNTISFALIVDDPDAPRGVFTHWVLYNIPGNAGELLEGIPTVEQLETGAVQGVNNPGRIGYTGPCPPPGPSHRYFFRLYALDTPMSSTPGSSKQQVLDAMQGHILAETEVVGTYQRSQ